MQAALLKCGPLAAPAPPAERLAEAPCLPPTAGLVHTGTDDDPHAFTSQSKLSAVHMYMEAKGSRNTEIVPAPQLIVSVARLHSQGRTSSAGQPPGPQGGQIASNLLLRRRLQSIRQAQPGAGSLHIQQRRHRCLRPLHLALSQARGLAQALRAERGVAGKGG